MSFVKVIGAVEDLQLLEIDLDKIANNENAVVEQYHISSAKVGFRMSEGDDLRICVGFNQSIRMSKEFILFFECF